MPDATTSHMSEDKTFVETLSSETKTRNLLTQNKNKKKTKINQVELLLND